MRIRSRLFPVLALCAAISLTAVGAGCGDDDGGDGGAESPAVTTEAGEDTNAAEETTAGGGEDSGNARAPSGDAVRAAMVEIEDFSYSPDPVTIEVGGKVSWINRDPVAHTATAEGEGFDTGTIEEGKRKSESFKQPGTYGYVCAIHPEMRGTVEVVEAG